MRKARVTPEMLARTANPYEIMGHRDIKMRSMFDNFIVMLQPSIVCDIGAMDRTESLRFSKLNKSLKVHAFEANPTNYKQYFGPNTSLAATPNIVCEHLAITNFDGSTKFNILNVDNTSEDWRRGASSMMQRNEVLNHTVVEVPCKTINSYFGDEIAKNSFMLWIDVEGALEQVIQGGAGVLRRTLALRVEVEQVEYWKDQKLAAEIKRMFQKSGFVEIADTYEPGGYLQSDKLFLNSKFLDLLT